MFMKSPSSQGEIGRAFVRYNYTSLFITLYQYSRFSLDLASG